MTLILPFKALRPSVDKANDVIAPPYDVLNSDEARVMAKDKPYSFLHISKPEIDLDEGIQFNDQRVYKKGAENLKKFINDKILYQDKKECLYIYEITLENKIQTGFGCIASVEAYNKNIIKKHEFTTPIKEDDRVLNIKELQVQTGPVLLAYKQNALIKKILDQNKKGNPVYSVIGPDSSIHNLWVIEDRVEIDKIVTEINSIGELYIADGHHRSAAASRICEEINLNESKNNTKNHNFFLSVAFPHSEMTILDYNRIISGLNNYSVVELINKISKNFVVKKVTSPYKPIQKNEFGMFLDNLWYKLNLKENLETNNDPVISLDVSILHDQIISPILGIDDERRDKRINFVGGARGLKELEKRVKNDKYDIAFSLFPTPIESLFKVADAGRVMPPKSTWFEPKLLDGLISHVIS
tara:strand:+ start:10227 stop:11465 length:1239 start_codon:yes stop_codon:yes gene_type:complete